MVDWLNEILFVAEVDLWVPADSRSRRHLPTASPGEGPGRAGREPVRLVKAATFHGLRVEEGTADCRRR